MRQKKIRQESLANKTVRNIVAFAILLILGNSVAAGIMIFNARIENYEHSTYAAVKLAASVIQGDDVNRYAITGVRDQHYLEVESKLNMIARYGELKYIYVIIPNENDIVYVWDALGVGSAEELAAMKEQKAKIDEHDIYSTGEREAFAKIKDGTWDEQLLIDFQYNNSEALASALVPVYDSNGNFAAIVGGDVTITSMFYAILNLFVGILFAVTVILVIGIYMYYKRIKKTVITPIEHLTTATSELVANLDGETKFKEIIHTGDELESLSRSIAKMDSDLRNYIKENIAITAEKERLSTELDLARRIQANSLPTDFLSELHEFDLYATMNPAKEVGGDFYDFFLLDDDHLGLVMADVSGKGIPAALFMMMSKIMLRNFAYAVKSPKAILEITNNLICANNSEQMFVTVWLGILNLRTGKLTAVNGGHEIPVLKSPDGHFEMYKDVHGFVVGGMEDMKYKEYEIQMRPGSKLFLYTDGLPEATDAKNELFGTARMCDALNTCENEDSKTILETMQRVVDDFVQEAPQADDLTMMCIEFYGDRKS